jgi:hypothetical protein
MYNLNYTSATLGVQSWREIISGGTRTKKVEYHCSRRAQLYYTVETIACRTGLHTRRRRLNELKHEQTTCQYKPPYSPGRRELGKKTVILKKIPYETFDAHVAAYDQTSGSRVIALGLAYVVTLVPLIRYRVRKVELRMSAWPFEMRMVCRRSSRLASML